MALPEDCLVEESPSGVYRVSGDVTPHTLATVTAWCASLDVMPDELGIERRTLEDVFLDLTGRSLRA
jgi:ABC-2 type transport system ATP-binding protein